MNNNLNFGLVFKQSYCIILENLEYSAEFIWTAAVMMHYCDFLASLEFNSLWNGGQTGKNAFTGELYGFVIWVYNNIRMTSFTANSGIYLFQYLVEFLAFAFNHLLTRSLNKRHIFYRTWAKGKRVHSGLLFLDNGQ